MTATAVLQCDVDADQPLLIVGSAHHTSIAMSMRLQTDQQTIAIVSLDYRRILGLLLQLSLLVSIGCCTRSSNYFDIVYKRMNCM